MTDLDDLTAQIREVVAETLLVETGLIDDSADLGVTYHADSLDLIEIVAQLEKRYGVLLPEAELPGARSVTALRSLLIKHGAGIH